MDRLKPCPFCGGFVTIVKGECGKDERFFFITRGYGERACKCRVFMESERFYAGESESEYRYQLAVAWNRRAGERNETEN